MADEKLAIDGGEPAGVQFRGPAYPGGERVGEEEVEAAVRVVRSGRLFRHSARQFPPPPSDNTLFESELAAFVGVPHAQATSSGTAALQCAVAALGISPGDEVLVPAYTFVATAAAIVLAGGVPVIVDVDASLGMSAADLGRRISPRTRGVVAVHMRGAACDVDAIREVADAHGLPVVEDVAQAAGATLRGRALGSLGQLGCFSFQYNKAITAGEGGAVVARDAELFRRVNVYGDTVAWLRPDAPADVEMAFGMNARLPEVSAAILRVQLGRLPDIVAHGRRRRHQLERAFLEATDAPSALRPLLEPDGDNGTSFLFFAPTVDAAAFVVDALRAERVFSTRVFEHERPGAHVFTGWRAMMNRSSWAKDGAPWSHARPELRYDPAEFAGTLDRLARAVQVDLHSNMEDAFYAGIARALDKVLRDPRAGFRARA